MQNVPALKQKCPCTALCRYIEETFDNWGSTLLANVTVKTFFPRTVAGVQNIIRWGLHHLYIIIIIILSSPLSGAPTVSERGFEPQPPGTPSTPGCGAWRATCSPAPRCAVILSCVILSCVILSCCVRGCPYITSAAIIRQGHSECLPTLT